MTSFSSVGFDQANFHRRTARGGGKIQVSANAAHTQDLVPGSHHRQGVSELRRNLPVYQQTAQAPPSPGKAELIPGLAGTENPWRFCNCITGNRKCERRIFDFFSLRQKFAPDLPAGGNRYPGNRQEGLPQGERWSSRCQLFVLPAQDKPPGKSRPSSRTPGAGQVLRLAQMDSLRLQEAALPENCLLYTSRCV